MQRKYDIEELDALTTEELWFVRYHAVGVPAVWARVELFARPGVGRSEVDAGSPWGEDLTVELDEPLPALTRPALLASADLGMCRGSEEAAARTRMSGGDAVPEYHTQAEYDRMILQARYAELFCRELHFGWPVPEFAEWAATQQV